MGFVLPSRFFTLDPVTFKIHRYSREFCFISTSLATNGMAFTNESHSMCDGVQFIISAFRIDSHSIRFSYGVVSQLKRRTFCNPCGPD